MCADTIQMDYNVNMLTCTSHFRVFTVSLNVCAGFSCLAETGRCSMRIEHVKRAISRGRFQSDFA